MSVANDLLIEAPGLAKELSTCPTRARYGQWAKVKTNLGPYKLPNFNGMYRSFPQTNLTEILVLHT